MTHLSAETLLENLQTVLIKAAGASGNAPPSPDAMRQIERAYGVHATHYGRLLRDLVCGSYAWDMFEGGASSTFPQHIRELSQCAPTLRIMRDSGELSERERLLGERDGRFVSLWQDPSLTEEVRRRETETLSCDYEKEVHSLAEKYRPRYEALRRATSERIVPLAAPRVHSRPILQPPLMALMFGVCHADRDTAFQPFLTHERGGLEYRNRDDVLQIRHPASPPPALLAPDAARSMIWDWVRGGVQTELAHLDAMAWDVAAIAVCAFFTRTGGRRGDETFLLLIDDYLDWRGIDPRKRSADLRREIAARIDLLCSERVQISSRTQLWTGDPETGRRRKTPILSQGPFLVKRSRFQFAGGAPAVETAPDGYLIGLGEWALPFVENRAMMGVFCRCLAEYDLRRQQWERRIGWYLVFQFNNQASRMNFEDVIRDGRERTLVTPQHPFKMRTVLAQSHVPWETMARTNPGKVITQWCDALGQLRKDGLLGEVACLDGALDGSDLPLRGRLDALLERRYRLVPGRLLISHLRAKKRAATARNNAVPS